MNNSKKRPLFSPDEVAVKLLDKLKVDYHEYSNIDPPTYDFNSKNQIRSLLKKYRFGNGNKNFCKRFAIDNFKNVNWHISYFDSQFHCLDDKGLRSCKTVPEFDAVLVRARSLAHEILGFLDTDRFFGHCQHGTGSSIGCSYTKSFLSSKGLLPMTSTEECRSIMSMYINWDNVLKERYQCMYPEKNFSYGAYHYFDVVYGNRLTTVPKNDLIDRVIAIEPTANMFLQQGLGRYIADRLIPFGVDIKTQQNLHRFEAWKSSMIRNLSTIDFSSASDCVGINLLRWLLPPDWFFVVDRLRSKKTFIDDEWLDLGCISTMGNATTFPLETLVFFVLGIASVDVTRNPGRSSFVSYEVKTSVSVFGDDCLIPTDASDLFLEVTQNVGFLVNNEKTFIGDVNFRESCGLDAMSGRNVRAFYLKAPESKSASKLRAWLYIVFNGLLKKSINDFGDRNYIYASSALRYVAGLISEYNKEIFIVPDASPDDSGVKTFSDWERLLPLFDGSKLSRVSVDRHGTYHFKFLRFVADTDILKNDNLYYWVSLKKMSFPLFSQVPNPFEVKKRGSYVVSSTTDCCAPFVGKPQ
jgi:hypothetical protein